MLADNGINQQDRPPGEPGDATDVHGAHAPSSPGGDATVIPLERLRSRRPREIRAQTISVKRLSKRELELGRVMYPPGEDEQRPRTRAECVGGPRPCPFVSCEFHLYADVSPRTGSIKLNFPDLEVDELAETCVLDVADRGGATLEEVGRLMNLTREAVRLVEVRALDAFEGEPLVSELADAWGYR